ncbi:MAG TPA: DNA recombination protein RmuC [Acidobacteriaceae bacterium]|nr:DNA recombination protein RmuC [Acidobacteriaceae bacterium]
MLPEIGIGLIVGLVVGWGIAWMRRGVEIARLNAEREHLEKETSRLNGEQEKLRSENIRVSSELSAANTELARLQAQQEGAKDKLDLLKDAREELSNQFKVLASNALSDNNRFFLSFAKQELGAQQESAKAALEAKEIGITKLLKPVEDALDKLQKATQDIEVKREGAYGTVLAEIKNIQITHQNLRRETSQLVQALRAPKARGNWGELQLKRCVEFAGMVQHASFDTQVFVRGEDVSRQPDCVVYLPNGRTIIIDAKTPLDAFLDASIETDEAARALRLAAHAASVREHLSQLSAKAYWKQFKDSPDFVVCFLPKEVLFSAALEQDPDLIEFGSNSSVILATPTTLIALLKAVAYGWQQMEVTRNAIAIREAGEKLYDKLVNAQDYLGKMGGSLTRAIGHYNSLIGCMEGGRGVFAQARRLHELGISQEEITELKRLDGVVREMNEDDWPAEHLSLAASADDGNLTP